MCTLLCWGLVSLQKDLCKHVACSMLSNDVSAISRTSSNLMPPCMSVPLGMHHGCPETPRLDPWQIFSQDLLSRACPTCSCMSWGDACHVCACTSGVREPGKAIHLPCRLHDLLCILDSLCKVIDAEPAWRARIEAMFPECMAKAQEYCLNSSPPGWLCDYYLAK